MGRSVIAGIKNEVFENLPERQKKAALTVMSRIMEDAYRRGLQQGVWLYEYGEIDKLTVSKLRHGPSLDDAPEKQDCKLAPKHNWDTSLNRLFIEHKQDLLKLGLVGYEVFK